MDLETVRLCFKKYISYLENNEKINLPEITNVDQLTIGEMDKLAQTMFMDYVVKSSEKINPTAVPCVLYKHVNTLIRQYIAEEQKGKPINSTSTKKKGWFW